MFLSYCTVSRNAIQLDFQDALKRKNIVVPRMADQIRYDSAKVLIKGWVANSLDGLRDGKGIARDRLVGGNVMDSSFVGRGATNRLQSLRTRAEDRMGIDWDSVDAISAWKLGPFARKHDTTLYLAVHFVWLPSRLFGSDPEYRDRRRYPVVVFWSVSGARRCERIGVWPGSIPYCQRFLGA